MKINHARLASQAVPGRLRTAALLAVMGLSLTISSTLLHAAEDAVQSQAATVRRQLIVLFDPTDTRSPGSTQIIDAVKGRVPNAALVSRIGQPNDARRVLEGVTAPAARVELARNPHERRALLEEYLLLTYDTDALADFALAKLLQDPLVLSVEPNSMFTLSADSTPSDHYFAQNPSQPGAGNYQWGMQLLNMPAAWGLERGIAYVAAVDGGIDCGTSNPCVQSGLHPDLKQNLRLHFSKNFFPSGGVNTDDNISQCSGDGCIAIHGTHVAGIIAATPQFGNFSNGTANSGVAGTCWTCSLSMLRVADTSNAVVGAAITYGVDLGARGINISFSDEGISPRYASCATGDYSLLCQALGNAADLDVVAVGASGNGYENRIQFPARASTVIAVGGLEYPGAFFRDGYGAGTGYPGNPCVPGVAGAECGSNYGTQDDGSPQIVAPAKDVVSTVYRFLNYYTQLHCGDQYGPDSGALDGYGDCTGTSMSAPHVTGLVGLVRSANPLLTLAQVKSILLSNTVACLGTDASKCGNGFPDAAKAVNAAFGGQSVRNRLTPLFSFYSSVGSDHVYTIAPQMANAALNTGRLIPQPPSASISYSAIGSATPGYSQFPIPPSCFSPCPSAATPRAMVSVFTSHVDPTNGSSELVPLYRMSWKCASSCSHVSHVYTTDANGIAAFQSVGYVVDGIEGYIFPSTKPQPTGTVKLCRKYAPSPRDDYVLFAGTGTNGTTCGTNDGYTKDAGGSLINDYTQTAGGTDFIGWVYPVRAPQAVYSTGYFAALNIFFFN